MIYKHTLLCTHESCTCRPIRPQLPLIWLPVRSWSAAVSPLRYFRQGSGTSQLCVPTLVDTLGSLLDPTEAFLTRLFLERNLPKSPQLSFNSFIPLSWVRSLRIHHAALSFLSICSLSHNLFLYLPLSGMKAGRISNLSLPFPTWAGSSLLRQPGGPPAPGRSPYWWWT